MNRWRPGSPTRTLMNLDGVWFTFKSNHPLEERIVELTDAYRDANGDFIPPELVEWDGVETCPGITLGFPEAR